MVPSLCLFRRSSNYSHFPRPPFYLSETSGTDLKNLGPVVRKGCCQKRLGYRRRCFLFSSRNWTQQQFKFLPSYHRTLLGNISLNNYPSRKNIENFYSVNTSHDLIGPNNKPYTTDQSKFDYFNFRKDRDFSDLLMF